MYLVAEFEDTTNKITKVYSISRTEREELKRIRSSRYGETNML